MTEKEIKRLRELSLPIAGNVLYIELTKEFVELFCKAMEELEASAKPENEIEGKSMLHNVTVKYEENKVLEKYWEMVAKKECEVAEFNMKTGKSTPMKKQIEDIKREESDHEPTPQEIAQFLSDSKADFVSVVQSYRFENELPF